MITIYNLIIAFLLSNHVFPPILKQIAQFAFILSLLIYCVYYFQYYIDLLLKKIVLLVYRLIKQSKNTFILITKNRSKSKHQERQFDPPKSKITQQYSQYFHRENTYPVPHHQYALSNILKQQRRALKVCLDGANLVLVFNKDAQEQYTDTK